MTVKTYRARSMQEALALVRQELGSQAAVLHTREVRARGLARLWGGGELVEVVASDNVSVPGRLPDPYLNARERSVPQTPAGIDLTEMIPPTEVRAASRSRVAAYLDQGVQPLWNESGRQNVPPSVRGGVPLLLVCGSKGAGATTVSWKLAQSLASQGRRTVWVDGDLTSCARATSPDSREGTLADVLSGQRTVHEVLTLGPDGVQCIRRAHGERPVATTVAAAKRCVHQLKGLSPHAEVVIVDAGSEGNPLLTQLWQAAGAVCVIVTPTEEAILHGYAMIKNHRTESHGVRLLTLVSRADESAAQAVAGRMAKACQQFLALNLVLAGTLPRQVEQMSEIDLDPLTERLWELLGSSECRAASIGECLENLNSGPGARR